MQDPFFGIGDPEEEAIYKACEALKEQIAMLEEQISGLYYRKNFLGALVNASRAMSETYTYAKQEGNLLLGAPAIEDYLTAFFGGDRFSVQELDDLLDLFGLANDAVHLLRFGHAKEEQS